MKTMVVIAFAIVGLFFASISHASPPKPNIVLVMADDQGWGQVGYNGHPYLKTPNLDAMAPRTSRKAMQRANVKTNNEATSQPTCCRNRIHHPAASIY